MESERLSNSYLNENNEQTQKDFAFYEIYHENDVNNNDNHLKRELEWIILEHSDKLEDNLINAFLDFEL